MSGSFEGDLEFRGRLIGLVLWDVVMLDQNECFPVPLLISVFSSSLWSRSPFVYLFLVKAGFLQYI